MEFDALGDMRVDGEQVQEIYRKFDLGQYLVNRRYQRKLVWTIEQKERLIDSMVRGLPIPLILLAERTGGGRPGKSYEIIDGLQRMHAIVSFIRNEYAYEGSYFDLETLASTKACKDNQDDPLTQKRPVLDRDVCVRLANYQLPVSAYTATNAASVDEVFRRINSSGRQLSRQEVRQAGLTSGLAGLVRRLSARVREDETMNDLLPLERISSISIRGPQEDSPGIDIDSVFWVKNKILRRDDLRGSLDEQIVLDLVLDMMDVREPLSTTTRNAAYDDSTAVGSTVAARLRTNGEDAISDRFDAAMQVCLELSDHIAQGSGPVSLMEFMGRPAGNPAGRYFHVFFMAIVACQNKGLQLDSIVSLADSVRDIWRHEAINPGGSWTFDDRRKHTNKFQKLISDAFSLEADGPGGRNDVRLLERDLKSYEIENARFELKGGLLPFDGGAKVPPAMIDKIIKICTAIANVGPNGRGRLYIGVTEGAEITAKYTERYGISRVDCVGSESFNFEIIGIDHEVMVLGESFDIYIGRLTKAISSSKKLTDEHFRSELIAGTKLLRIVDRDGSVKHVVAIHVPAVDTLVDFDGSYWVKSGSDTDELKGKKVAEKIAEFAAAH